MLFKLNRRHLLVASVLVVAVIAAGCWFSLSTQPSVTSIMGAKDPEASASANIKADYGKLPLSFEANHGQTDGKVKFLARGSGYALFLTANEAVLRLRNERAGGHAHDSNDPPSAVLRIKLEGTNANPQVAGLEELPGKSNYFIGNDPRQWRTDIPTYAKVKYEAVYPGVNLVYYGTQGRQLEYDFVVAAGADPRQIKLSFAGADKLELDGQGDLLVHSAGRQMRMHKPGVYQEKDRVREEVAGHYTLSGEQEVGFDIAAYDAARPLVIDPVLAYSTYLGGSGQDIGLGIAVSAHGDAFVTGLTTSADFPTEPSGSKFGPGGGVDAFVSKLNAAGTQLVYSTYLGGSNDENLYSTFDVYSGIAVNSAGNAYVTGLTSSPDFPTKPGGKQQNYGGGPADAYVTKLNITGNGLEYSTFLGGDGWEGGHSIAVDAAGNAYVAGALLPGNVLIPPTTPNDAPKGAYDGFVAILNSTGSNLNFFSYLGGSNWDGAAGIAVDAQANFYVVGSGASNDLNVTSNAYQQSLKGVTDIFIWKFKAGGAADYVSYLGGAAKSCPTNPDDVERIVNHGIAVEPQGDIIYVAGQTDSTDFPTNNPMQLDGCFAAFVAKLDLKQSNNQLVYSKFLSGSNGGAGRAVAVDINGNAYVTGTSSGTFPATGGMPTCSDTGAFVVKLATDGAIKYATCLSGAGEDVGHDLAVDPAGCAYVTGYTQSANFPVVNPFQPSFAGGIGAQPQDGFVTKICDGLDHFKCYDVRPQESFLPFNVTLIDQFENEQVMVLRPVTLCNPVVKCIDDHNPTTPPDCTQVLNHDAHLLCYETRDDSANPQFERRQVIVSNQFGQEQQLTVLRRTNLLCVPALKAHVDVQP